MLRRLLPAVVGLVLISVISGAQNVSRNDCIIPQDGIIENRLDNGLRYVVAHNGSPSRMIECFRRDQAFPEKGAGGLS